MFFSLYIAIGYLVMFNMFIAIVTKFYSLVRCGVLLCCIPRQICVCRMPWHCWLCSRETFVRTCLCMTPDWMLHSV